MIKPVPLLTEELPRNVKPNVFPTRVLYDTQGVTRTFLVKGVEALRTIPPFYYANEPNSGESRVVGAVEALPAIEEVSEAAEEADGGLGWSEEDEPQFLGPVTIADMSDAYSESSSTSSSSYSPSSASSSLYLSDVEMSDDSDADEPDAGTPPCAVSPPPRDASANETQSRSTTGKVVSSRHPSPVRASLSIEWPPNEGSTNNVVYETPKSRSPSPVIPPRPKTKSPSPLPSLTPSPPPTMMIVTPRKRPSPSGSRPVCIFSTL